MPMEFPKQPWHDRVTETAARVEEELRLLAAYINDEVVPDVRRHGSEALRKAAVELHKMAQKMDDGRGPGTGSSAPPPPKM